MARPAIEPLPQVRESVRDLLLSAPAFRELDPESRRSLAQALVTVCHAAIALIREEALSDEAVSAPASAPPLATAQSAGTQFSGVAADRVAGTTRSILNAVSFPRFVTELINGVFKALVDSNQQQMRSYLDLIKNVAASTEDFAETNLGPARARQWLVEGFPAAFEFESAADQDTDPSDPGQEPRIRLKEGATPPSEAALRTMLGLSANETVSPGDPESGLVPLVRRNLARQRQQMLASMVMLGMQRIVVESGRLNAAMRFHIDTRSAAASDQGSSFDEHNQIEVGAKFGVAGAWGGRREDDQHDRLRLDGARPDDRGNEHLSRPELVGRALFQDRLSAARADGRPRPDRPDQGQYPESGCRRARCGHRAAATSGLGEAIRNCPRGRARFGAETAPDDIGRTSCRNANHGASQSVDAACEDSSTGQNTGAAAARKLAWPGAACRIGITPCAACEASSTGPNTGAAALSKRARSVTVPGDNRGPLALGKVAIGVKIRGSSGRAIAPSQELGGAK